MTVVLWVALAAPLAAALGAWWAPDGESARWLARAAALVGAALWVVVAVTGDADAGPVAATGVVAAVGVGACLLFAATTRPLERRNALLGALVLFAVPAGPAAAAGDGGTPELAAALLAAGGIALFAGWKDDDEDLRAGLVAAAGAIVAVQVLTKVVRDTSSLDVPTGPLALGDGLALVAGGGLLAAAALLQPRRLPAPLLAGGLALALEAAALLDRGGDALALAAVAGALVLLARWPDPRARPGALALVALAAAAVPAGTRPAALLLAAGAVLAAVVLHPLAALAGLPGAAALVVALADEPTAARVALGVGVAIALVLLAQRPGAEPAVAADADDNAAPVPLAAVVPALVVAAWLVLLPTTWGWVGGADLTAWAGGAAVATAASVAGLGVAWFTRSLPFPAKAALGGPDPRPAARTTPVRTLVVVTPLCLLGLSLLALVASAVLAT